MPQTPISLSFLQTFRQTLSLSFLCFHQWVPCAWVLVRTGRREGNACWVLLLALLLVDSDPVWVILGAGHLDNFIGIRLHFQLWCWALPSTVKNSLQMPLPNIFTLSSTVHDRFFSTLRNAISDGSFPNCSFSEISSDLSSVPCWHAKSDFYSDSIYLWLLLPSETKHVPVVWK